MPARTPHLFDDIRNERFSYPPWIKGTDELDGVFLQKWLDAAVLIDADNVSEYFWAETSQDYFDWSKDFPCLMPPFDAFFIEMSRPSCVLAEKKGALHSDWLPRTWGYLFGWKVGDVGPEDFTPEETRTKVVEEALATIAEAERTDPVRVKATKIIFEGVLRNLINDKKADPMAFYDVLAEMTKRGEVGAEELTLMDAWMKAGVLSRLSKESVTRGMDRIKECVTVSASLFADFGDSPLADRYGKGVKGPLCFHTMTIDPKTGQMIMDAPQTGVIGAQSPNLSSAEKNESLVVARMSEVMLMPAALAITFMHCNNVQQVEGAAPRGVQKAWSKRNNKPLSTYRTLHIEPMRKSIRKASGGSTDLKHALHIMRGHFKDYREGAGLFGKNKGLFWWDMLVRGSPKEGIVTKDYSVGAPRQES